MQKQSFMRADEVAQELGISKSHAYKVIHMRVNEVAEELGISIPFAYRIIRQMNEELAKTGCITIAGRIDRKFFHEKFYGTRSETERKEK